MQRPLQPDPQPSQLALQLRLREVIERDRAAMNATPPVLPALSESHTGLRARVPEGAGFEERREELSAQIALWIEEEIADLAPLGEAPASFSVGASAIDPEADIADTLEMN